ncbi:hypothetical protein LINGRAHAP2_LOCUS34346 [Linum grandiflorum]
MVGADWGPVIIAVGLFILLSPGLLFQLPARTRVVEFGNLNTSGIAILVPSVDVDTNSQDENSIDCEEDESVNRDGFAIGLQASKLDLSAVSWELEQEPWCEQDEQDYPYQDWTPVSHWEGKGSKKRLESKGGSGGGKRREEVA